MKVRTIDVYPNPYAYVDADGVPQAVVQMPGTRNYVGAFLDVVATEKTGKNRFYFAKPNTAKGEEAGVHGLRKVTVPFTAEIARAVLEGGLIVADPKHARMCGLADFDEPAKRLDTEREIALGDMKARLGPDSEDEAEIKDPPTEPTERKEGEERVRADLVLSGTVNDPRLVISNGEEA